MIVVQNSNKNVPDRRHFPLGFLEFSKKNVSLERACATVTSLGLSQQFLLKIARTSRSQVFSKIGVLINFASFTGKNLC